MAKDDVDTRKACGKPCPRCNDENVGYCGIKVPPDHTGSGEMHSCVNCGAAW